MIHEHSAGSIIYRINNTKIQYLLVKEQFVHIWCFPKGHLEKGETSEQAAKREVAEEVGLHPKFDFTFKRKTTYSLDKNRIKTVDFYIAQFDDAETVKIQKDEIEDYIWVDKNHADKYLEYKDLITFMNDAEKYIKGRKIII